MNIKILAVGTRMPSWVEEGYKDFSQRIRSMQNLELIEVPLAKRTKTSDMARIKSEEAGAIERRLKGNEKIVVLDVKGKPLTTESLAVLVGDWQMAAQDIAILIGGPDGLDQRFLTGKYQKLSLSGLTMPHPLVRLLLIEQIYRALAINSNHPYHRE